MRSDPPGAGVQDPPRDGEPSGEETDVWPDIGGVIAAHAAARPASPALVASGQPVVTFAALAAFLRAAASEIARCGISADARIGLLVPPGLSGALLVLAFASQAQLVPLNPALTPDELGAEIRRTALDALILPDWLETELSVGLENGGPLLIDAALGQGLRLVLSPRDRLGLMCLGHRSHADSIALLLRSSGTTGDPKQIPVTHRNLLAMARKMAAWFDLTSADRIPCTLPLYYAAGLKTTLFVPLLIGASVAIPAPGRAYDVAEWMAVLRPTVLSVAPAPLRGMLDRLRAMQGRPVTPFLRFAICGAAYLPDSLRREAEALLGVPVLEYYGLSEAGAMAANPAPPGLRKPGTVGLVPSGELVLLDACGQPVPQGEVGEVHVTGPSVTPGYVTAQERKPSGLRDGWLATGDIGCMDADGYLTIVGRLKELINRGGEKVSPYEVEKALLAHPLVLEAGVFGVPHPRLGENVAAAVVLRPGADVGEEELKQSLETRLARFKIPQGIDIVEALPRGVTGKLLRPQLAQAFATRVRARTGRPDRMLEHQLLAIWVRLLQREDLGINDDFFQAGGDSLLATEMLTELELLTRRPLGQSQLASSLTIRLLADAVCADLGQNREMLTQLRAGTGTPFFFCHGDYTTRGLFALRLMDMIEADRPIYLLHFYQDLHRPDLTIEEVAASYVAEIRNVLGEDAVVIGGYCNGGLVAWELTHQLRRAGVHVRALMLVETPSLNARPACRALHRAITLAGHVVPGHAGAVLQQEGMRALWHRMRGHGTFQSLFQHVATRAWRRLTQPGLKPAHAVAAEEPSPHWLYQRTLSRYVPPRLDVPLTCYIALDGRLTDTDARYWRALSPQVKPVDLPGTHHSIVTSEAAALAKAMQETLARTP